MGTEVPHGVIPAPLRTSIFLGWTGLCHFVISDFSVSSIEEMFVPSKPLEEFQGLLCFDILDCCLRKGRWAPGETEVLGNEGCIDFGGVNL